MFADRINNLTESPVREILKLTEQPSLVSFAGGLPAPECFPLLNFSEIDRSCLQYGASEGERELRQQVAATLSARGLHTTDDRVLILSGSQQGIDLVAKLLIDKGTKVAVESPTYLAALQAFDLFGASYVAYTPAHPDLKDASLTYAISTFQNPTGHCYSIEQRRALAQACDDNGGVLFEDDPYRDLVYGECDRKPVCSYVKKAAWIYQSSFSKTIAPGLRLGYLTCSESLFPYLVKLKQAADLHSCRVSQYLVSELIKNDGVAYAAQIKKYRKKRDVFNRILEQEFSEMAEWSVPVGGLFFWLRLKREFSIDTRQLLPLAIKNGVAFMPGESFFPQGVMPESSLRLNFSHASDASVAPGLKRLAETLKSVVESRV